MASDEEDEDGEDEDAERGGREKHRAMDVKSGSTPAEGSRIEPDGLESRAVSVGNSQESCTGVEKGNQEPSCCGDNVKLTAPGNKMVIVVEEEPTQMATTGTSRTVREEPSTGEMVSSHDLNEKLMEYVYIFQRDL